MDFLDVFQRFIFQVSFSFKDSGIMRCFIVFADYYILQCAGDHLFYEVIEIELNMIIILF